MSLRSTNLLYFVSMLVVITAGSVIQTFDLSWGLIATEVLLIAAPAILWLKVQRIPLRQGLRLGPISAATGALSVLAGAGMYFFGLFIEVVLIQLTGQMPTATGSSPALTGFGGALYFIAMAISAPVCEEILFRGAIQSAYEGRKSARFAITITALMFAFYHFRLTDLPALIPIAFLLCYVAWRTRSIFATMLVHFGNNAFSAALAVMAGNGIAIPQPVGSLWLGLAGLLVAALALFAIMRLNPAPAAATAAEAAAAPATPAAPARPAPGWLGTYWPLLAGGALYLAVVGMTLAVMLSPESRASTQFSYSPPRIDKVVTSRYRITNRAGENVGELVCNLSPLGSTFMLECTRSVKDYEVNQASSYYKEGAHSTKWTVVWDAKTIEVLKYRYEPLQPAGYGYSARYEDGRLSVQAGEDSLGLVPSGRAMFEYEWAWHADMLQTNAGDVWKIPYVRPLAWDQQLKKSTPSQQDTVLQVGADEALDLPAGHFTVRKMSFGSQAAWYAKDDPGYPRPVKFEDAMTTYELLP